MMLEQKHSWCQFPYILCSNFSNEHHFGSFFYVHVTREKLPKQRLYEKFARKMLMKLTTSWHLTLYIVSHHKTQKPTVNK